MTVTLKQTTVLEISALVVMRTTTDRNKLELATKIRSDTVLTQRETAQGTNHLSRLNNASTLMKRRADLKAAREQDLTLPKETSTPRMLARLNSSSVALVKTLMRMIYVASSNATES